MFNDFIMASRKNKAQLFLNAIKAEVKDWREELDQDFLDYMWLAEHSINHKEDSIHTVCAEVVWPMILGNYFLEHEDSKPVAYASWALFSKSVSDLKMTAHRTALTRHDHGSGPELWLMDVIAPWGHARKTIAKLIQTKHELGLSKSRVNFRRWYADRRLNRYNNALPN
jgi:hemolysin-activating ACP:hemolysin acyltransferase